MQTKRGLRPPLPFVGFAILRLAETGAAGLSTTGDGHEMTMDGIPLGPSGVVAPTVDVIIVNLNYAAFLGEAIDSLRRQTHGLFRGIIVDNCSTDDSLEVARRHIDGDPRFMVIALDRNYGHFGGALQGLKQCNDEFVVFLDADDTLFPNFLAAHLQVHLAAQWSLALSSSQAIEIAANGTLLNGEMSYFGSDSDDQPRGLKPRRIVPRLAALSDDEYEHLAAQTRYVSDKVTGWLWAPGTSNMYRRSMMDLFMPAFDRDPILTATDATFNHALHAITGSALIMQPLSARRLHGRNNYAALPVLTHIRSGSAEADRVASERRIYVLKTVVTSIDRLARPLRRKYFFATFDHVPKREGADLKAFLNGLEDVLAENFTRIADAYGERPVVYELGRRMQLRTMLRVLSKAGRRTPANVVTLLAAWTISSARDLWRKL